MLVCDWPGRRHIRWTMTDPTVDRGGTACQLFTDRRPKYRAESWSSSEARPKLHCEASPLFSHSTVVVKYFPQLIFDQPTEFLCFFSDKITGVTCHLKPVHYFQWHSSDLWFLSPDDIIELFFLSLKFQMWLYTSYSQVRTCSWR